MSTDEATKLLRLKSVTIKFNENKQILHQIWENMHNFAQGIRNELDDMYWTDNKIGFEDLETVPEFNQFRFNYKDLERLFNIEVIKETLQGYRELLEEKNALENELGFSMDKKS